LPRGFSGKVVDQAIHRLIAGATVATTSVWEGSKGMEGRREPGTKLGKNLVDFPNWVHKS